MGVTTFAELEPLCHVVSIPLTSPFRGIQVREALIVEGPIGPAEWSPFVEYDDSEASVWLRSALEGAFDSSFTAPATVVVNGIVPAVNPDQVSSLLESQGMPSVVKVKVAGAGSTLRNDVERVSEVRRILGPVGRIRLDANGAWSLDEAEHAIREMEHLDLDFVEQPVMDVGDMAELRRRISRLGIGVAADESIRRFADIDVILAAGACDVAVVKVQPLGGVQSTIEVASKAINAGVEVVVSSALETSVGLYAGAQLVGWLADHTDSVQAAGLGTGPLLTKDIVRTPLRPEGGLMAVSKPVLDPERIAEIAASSGKRDWWVARLERCLALL